MDVYDIDYAQAMQFRLKQLGRLRQQVGGANYRTEEGERLIRHHEILRRLCRDLHGD